MFCLGLAINIDLAEGVFFRFAKNNIIAGSIYNCVALSFFGSLPMSIGAASERNKEKHRKKRAPHRAWRAAVFWRAKLLYVL
jgi:hypothetical protein